MPYRSIEDPAKLRRVLEATLLLEADLNISDVLRHFLEEACSMTGARYGAIGVLNDDRSALAEFITVGLSPEEEALIGPRPTGRGILGLLIHEPHPVRLADLAADPHSVGFPPNHPPMTSFLGVPIVVRGEVYGNLYLTNKVGWGEFTADDEALVGALALSAGIGIENARLHEQVQRAAVYEDRDRLARDLHDTVIQRLFAVGLSLQGVVGAVGSPRLVERLESAITELDATIRQVRSTIFALGTADVGVGVRRNVIALLDELSTVTGFEVRPAFEGLVDTAVTDEVAEHLLAVLREAITNIGRHAEASRANVTVNVSDGFCRLEVGDDGKGLSERTPTEGGLGLGNMRRRAEKLGGSFSVESPDAGGTIIVWQVPLG